MSSFMNVGASDGGRATTPSNLHEPSASAATVAATIPISIAPLTPRASQHRHERERAEREQHRRRGQSRPSVTSVPGASTTMPPHSRPISAIEQADADADRVLERFRHGRDDALAQADAGGEDEDQSPRSPRRRARPARACRAATTTVKAKKKL